MNWFRSICKYTLFYNNGNAVLNRIWISVYRILFLLFIFANLKYRHNSGVNQISLCILSVDGIAFWKTEKTLKLFLITKSMFSRRIQIVKLLYLRRYLLSSKKLTPVPSGIKYLWLEYNMIIREQFNKKYTIKFKLWCNKLLLNLTQ